MTLSQAIYTVIEAGIGSVLLAALFLYLRDQRVIR